MREFYPLHQKVLRTTTDHYGRLRTVTDSQYGTRDVDLRMMQKTNAAIAAAGQGARSSLRGSRGEEPPGGARRSGDLRAWKRARSGGVKGSAKPHAQSAHTPLVAKAVLWKTAARSRAEEVEPDKNPPLSACQTLKNSAADRRLAENDHGR